MRGLDADGEPGDHDGELAACDEGAAGPPAARALDAGAAGGEPAGGDLRQGGDDGEEEGGEQDRRDVGGVGGQAEEDEEDGGEQVPQRGEEVARALGDLTGQGDADEEGADGGGDLEFLGEAGDEQGEAEDDQQQHLGVVGGDGAADDASVAQGDVEDTTDRAEGDQQGDGTAREADACEQGGEDRQVEGHGEVLDDEDTEHDGGFAVAEPAQVAEDLGDDAGGGDPGDAGERDGGHRAPAEQQRGDGSGYGVEEEVDRAGRVLRLEVGDEFGGAVFEAEQEQQEDDADLGAGRGELLAGLEGRMPPWPKASPARR
ncbi:hypothetical protein GCM10020256_09360 [Streptomyces thermocoprophilus]